MRHRLAMLLATIVVADTATKALAWTDMFAGPVEVNSGAGTPFNRDAGINLFFERAPVWNDRLMLAGLMAAGVLIIRARLSRPVQTGLILVLGGYLSHALERALLYPWINSFHAWPARGVTDWIPTGGLLLEGPINVGDLVIVLGLFVLVAFAVRAAAGLVLRAARQLAVETA